MRDGRAGGGRGVSRNAHSAGPERMAWLSFTGSRRNSPFTGPGLPGEAGEKQCVDVKGTLAVPPARVLLSVRQRQPGEATPRAATPRAAQILSFYPLWTQVASIKQFSSVW